MTAAAILDLQRIIRVARDRGIDDLADAIEEVITRHAYDAD